MQITDIEANKLQGERRRDMDASEDLMIGMWSHERNTFCTPPPASISKVIFNNHALSFGKNNCDFITTRFGQHSAGALHRDVK